MIDQIKQFILDIIFPSFCLSCHKEGTVICNTCLGSIKVNRYFYCPACNRRLADFNKRPTCHKTSLNGLMVANVENSNLLHQLIYNYKYKFIRDLSVPLSKILIRYLENISVYDDFRQSIDSKNVVIIPVPLHKRRLSWRGFNQAGLIAESIGRHFVLSVDNKILYREKNSTPQKDIEAKLARQENIKNAFSLYPHPLQEQSLKGKTVILVDDICTTGATLEECAKAIRPLKPKQIWGLALTRG